MSFGYLSLGFGSFPSRFSPAIFGPRGLAMGGTGSGGKVNIIEFITIATTGNATDFGDLTSGGYYMSSCANGIRGVIGGGSFNALDYVTIQTTGNASTFGNLSVGRAETAATSGD